MNILCLVKGEGFFYGFIIEVGVFVPSLRMGRRVWGSLVGVHTFE